ncbi:MAG: RT0821/Lpp0805 family surface protein [Pseudomonadota bacterium]|nr:RT0821/Lpp0805 family surface protein [Pseudomonadota bacterium]
MKKSLVFAMVFFLTACSGNSRMTNGQLIGSVGGGIIGTYVGSQIGAGSGNLLFIVAGATLGSLVGYSYGDSLIPSDRAKFKEATKVAMDNIADGEVYSWVNPDSGVAGTITPVRSYHVEQDQICRDFKATISVDKRIGKTNGRACKISADAWLVDSRT